MLVNAKKMLDDAKKGNYAIAQLNINNLEWTKFILEEAETLKMPVILGVSEGAAKYMGGYPVVYNLVSALHDCLNITIPVALHLDHASSFDACKKAMDAGFTSVMIDASHETLEENIRITNEVVAYARVRNVTVEGEVGHIGGEEDGVVAEVLYAELEDCEKYVAETNVDFLASAIGTVHGIYKGEPNLNFELMKKIKDALNIPLVLHGGTGIPDDKIKKAIACGTCKINFNTEMQLAWSKAVREFLKEDAAVYDPRKIIKSGEKALKEAVRQKIELLKK